MVSWAAHNDGKNQMTTSPRHPAVIIAAALLLGLSACDDADDNAAGAPKAEPPTVSVVGVASKDIVRTSEFIGSVEAVDDVDLIARVEGFLQETLVEDGASVAAGDVLFRIEPENFAAAKAWAKAGNRDLALEHLQTYLDVMRNADDDNERVQEATALLQRLVPRS